MKYLVISLLAAALCSSCVRKQVVLEATGQRDSLATVVEQKDSLINSVFEDINAISRNLSLISSRENLIALAGEQEGGNRPIEQIRADIAAIDRLLQENKAKIASLQRSAAQLRKANLRIDALERTIADLNERLLGKKAEVEQLREELANMGTQVETLSERVAEQTTRAERLDTEKHELENRMNTVHYIVGAEKELREAQIIDKQGFIGRTLTVNRNSALDSFTQADSRLLTEVPIGHRKVTLVTTHPEGSYEWVPDGNKGVLKLVINDPDRFWASSKILVVSYK